nr:MAG TPA: hypothetical protein [Bacteriophage sp.]
MNTSKWLFIKALLRRHYYLCHFCYYDSCLNS